jgi:hypothetical protein
MNLTKDKSKAKDLTEFLTKYYVNEGDKLFTKYASEVADSSKAKVFKGAQKAVDGLNFLNRMQEFYYRRGMFATSIQNTLAEKGIDINKIGIGDDLYWTIFLLMMYQKRLMMPCTSLTLRPQITFC